MENLITTINKLQDICNATAVPLNIDLPNIVVVGIQSSGKSSVIESITRREFLPRGEGIVTRRPIIIRLNKTQDLTEYVKFNHSEKIFRDFDDVRQEIENETERLCGKNKRIESKEIILNLYSKETVNLTLVDLPGLVLLPDGDQPEDIESQVQDLVRSYIVNPLSIILVIHAANQDPRTGAGLKLAQSVDPEGRRTLVVLTKLDTIDPGQHALNLFNGIGVLKSRLGVVGVVNRKQLDLESGKSIEDAIRDEGIFLRNNYPTLANKHGTTYLTKRLCKILMRHIENSIPDLTSKINSLISRDEAQLEAYGPEIPNKDAKIIRSMGRFSDLYRLMLEADQPRKVKTTELSGGARITYILRDSFGEALSKIDPLDNLDSTAILTAAKNMASLGTKINEDQVFKQLVSEQIERLEETCISCVNLVHTEMVNLAKQTEDDVKRDLLRFPKLRDEIEKVLKSLLDSCLPATRQAVKDYVKCRTTLIEIEDPMPRDLDILQDTNLALSSRHQLEMRQCERIAWKVKTYFKISVDAIKDHVPRLIVYHMVNRIKDTLHDDLIEKLHKPEKLDELLEESPDIAMLREETRARLDSLRKAAKTITSILQAKAS